MKPTTILLSVLMISTITLSVESCTSFFTTSSEGFDVREIVPEPRENGCVLKIVSRKEIDNVSAWIGQGNWLYISIPDTSINLAQINRLSDSRSVERTQVFRYQSAVQITLLMKDKFDHADVLHYPDDTNIYVVLYKQRSNE